MKMCITKWDLKYRVHSIDFMRSWTLSSIPLLLQVKFLGKVVWKICLLDDMFYDALCYENEGKKLVDVIDLLIDSII